MYILKGRLMTLISNICWL